MDNWLISVKNNLSTYAYKLSGSIHYWKRKNKDLNHKQSLQYCSNKYTTHDKPFICTVAVKLIQKNVAQFLDSISSLILPICYTRELLVNGLQQRYLRSCYRPNRKMTKSSATFSTVTTHVGVLKGHIVANSHLLCHGCWYISIIPFIKSATLCPFSDLPIYRQIIILSSK